MIKENNGQIEHFFARAKLLMKGALTKQVARIGVPLTLGNIDNEKWNRLFMAKFESLEERGYCTIDKGRPSKIRIHSIGYEGLKILFGRKNIRKKSEKNMLIRWVDGEMKYMKRSGYWKFVGNIGVFVRGVDGVWRAHQPASGVARQARQQLASQVNASNS